MVARGCIVTSCALPLSLIVVSKGALRMGELATTVGTAVAFAESNVQIFALLLFLVLTSTGFFPEFAFVVVGIFTFFILTLSVFPLFGTCLSYFCFLFDMHEVAATNWFFAVIAIFAEAWVQEVA